jgi:uncharacterized protein DUF3592
MKRFLLLWLAGASLIAIVLGSVNIPRLYSLSRRGITTCGTIAAEEPNNHRTLRYSYQVNGETYSGGQQGYGGDLLAFSSGCAIVVVYLPEDPHISCIGDPTSMLNNEAIPVLLSMLIFPTFALLAWMWRYPAFRRWLMADARGSVESPTISSN